MQTFFGSRTPSPRLRDEDQRAYEANKNMFNKINLFNSECLSCTKVARQKIQVMFVLTHVARRHALN